MRFKNRKVSFYINFSHLRKDCKYTNSFLAFYGDIFLDSDFFCDKYGI